MTSTMPAVDHYENFPVASWLCPPHLRGAVVAIYHFARTADDLADEGSDTAEQRLAQLAAYRQALKEVTGAQIKFSNTAPLPPTDPTRLGFGPRFLPRWPLKFKTMICP
jgi:phytoene/squalene synthetase